MKKIQVLDDLKTYREKAKDTVSKDYSEGIKVIIGMGTCGKAAGAAEVRAEVLNELQKRKVEDISVNQTGCIGMCDYEVLLDVMRPGEGRVTYGRVTPRDISRIVGEHVINGRIVEDKVLCKISEEELKNVLI
ncbi:(2Fe-2S) ferredoxin domain-containing protein [Natranaerofaba carboxydovora]|uniref:(2Fe-2S) ferredoxin domain-containing protein n=1 Tax=Natranaerofaba carboxydovora TaxID=2742683 RepID=UPI001F13CE95|nr:(2Fe-2S) ferredoxin domain-containing protein [Natranaerofaba carboxydovora]UMZ72772.1 NADP-reducing hydrogenase subunit HndB [Natranaerofaba carboxydovora]